MKKTSVILALATVIGGGLTGAAYAQSYWPDRAYPQDRYWSSNQYPGYVYGNGQYIGRDGGLAHLYATANGHNKYTTSGH